MPAKRRLGAAQRGRSLLALPCDVLTHLGYKTDCCRPQEAASTSLSVAKVIRACLNVMRRYAHGERRRCRSSRSACLLQIFPRMIIGRRPRAASSEETSAVRRGRTIATASAPQRSTASSLAMQRLFFGIDCLAASQQPFPFNRRILAEKGTKASRLLRGLASRIVASSMTLLCAINTVVDDIFMNSAARSKAIELVSVVSLCFLITFF